MFAANNDKYTVETLRDEYEWGNASILLEEARKVKAKLGH